MVIWILLHLEECCSVNYVKYSRETSVFSMKFGSNMYYNII